jgi:hypothetical protein
VHALLWNYPLLRRSCFQQKLCTSARFLLKKSTVNFPDFYYYHIKYNFCDSIHNQEMPFPSSAQDRDFRHRNAKNEKSRRKQAKATYNGPRTAYWSDQNTIDAEIAEDEFYSRMCCTGDDIFALREEHIFMYAKDMPSFMNKPMYIDETKERRAMAKLHRLLYRQQFS